MWVITHVLAGLALAAAFAAAGATWWLILLVVLVVHVLMDLVPHWDYTVSRHPVAWGVLDFLASLAAFLLAWLTLDWPFWLALMGLVSGSPDWDVLIAELRGGHARKLFPSHWDSFPHGRSGPAWGIGVQVAVMAASVVVVLAAGP
jgi:hypothetical protein